MDLSKTIIAKSDQLNADDLLTGPRTFTVAGVREGSEEQPVSIVLAEWPQSRPFKPSKTVQRILAYCWGVETDDWPQGARMTLFRDEKVKWAGEEIGGIRVSHLSHIDGPKKVALQESKHKKSLHTILPLRDAPTPNPLADRIQAMLAAYSKGGITHAMLEAHEGRAVSEWDEGNVANLSALFEALKSGAKKKADEFPELDDAQTGADA